MEFVWVADSSELLPGQTKSVLVDGYDILVVNAEGSFYASVGLPGEKGFIKRMPLQTLVDASQLYVSLPDPPH